ncbi:tetratricopeptide repeat protein [Sphingobacterium sp. BIGb0165]|uniref:tetratricopeptide repeat protein n=1 Tax=Sphingobacterium sp. BIGb0165 TaxID=2940615 RepID=UPI00216A795A|nr:tetratricopeptide repeat protein [Sphingobacterium sp. BIGb0165]MCS4226941.1 tetratricopeptide (TPR) repeat protein [Sphingobacterium sp. BIGb0165]
MTDWFRRKTWTPTDEQEFFTKLIRARKYNHPQILRIQALALVEAKDNNLLDAAEMLLNRVLTEYSDNRIERSQTYNQLGNIYRLRNDLEKALIYFQKSIDFEKEFPNVISISYLDFSEIIVQAQKTEFYDDVYSLLLQRIDQENIQFPIENYVVYSLLSFLANFKGDTPKAKEYAHAASTHANKKTNSLWNVNKNKIGIVKERKSWLDKLLKYKKN